MGAILSFDNLGSKVFVKYLESLERFSNVPTWKVWNVFGMRSGTRVPRVSERLNGICNGLWNAWHI